MQMNLGVPTARAAHAMCAVDKYLVIFGGKDAKARLNDLHIFDTGLCTSNYGKYITVANIISVWLYFVGILVGH